MCSIAVMQLLGLGTGEPFLRVLGSPLREWKAGCVYGWYNGGAASGWLLQVNRLGRFWYLRGRMWDVGRKAGNDAAVLLSVGITDAADVTSLAISVSIFDTLPPRRLIPVLKHKHLILRTPYKSIAMLITVLTIQRECCTRHINRFLRLGSIVECLPSISIQSGRHNQQLPLIGQTISLRTRIIRIT